MLKTTAASCRYSRQHLKGPMSTDPQNFLRQFMSVVAKTLAPVVFLAFVSMPVNLGRHAGVAAPCQVTSFLHMT